MPRWTKKLCCTRMISMDENDANGIIDGIEGNSDTHESEDKTFYKMNHLRRGTAVIFNHEYFDMHDLSPRTGTKVDCDNIKECLLYLGFDVEVYEDLTYLGIRRIIDQVVNYDHSECDCLVLVVLSHGEEGILHAKDAPYQSSFLWNSFTSKNCPSLEGKPKIFFIQACQGDRLDSGITLHKTQAFEGDEPDSGRIYSSGTTSSHRIITHPDFLLAYSTVPGYYSWRNPVNGSWFMQSLYESLKQWGTELDILTILTFVIRNVATKYESYTPYDPSMHKKKQIPCLMSTLTHRVKFSK